MRIQPHFIYDMIITWLCAGIYAYICSMVKDRMRAESHPKFARVCTRIYAARIYGADYAHTHR